MGIFTKNCRSLLLQVITILLMIDLSSAQTVESAQPVPIASSVDSVDRPCVLMSNGNVVFGSAQQIGDLVLITKGEGNVLRVQYREVACWASSLTLLHRYRVDHRSSNGPSPRLDDVDWCLRYGLIDLADADLAIVLQNSAWQAQAAIEGRSKSLQRQIAQQRNRNFTTLAEENLPVLNAAWNSSGNQLSSKVKTVGFSEQSGTSGGKGQEVPFDRAVLFEFTRNVQPLLLNRCGKCHSQSNDQQWSLRMPLGRTRP